MMDHKMCFYGEIWLIIPVTLHLEHCLDKVVMMRCYSSCYTNIYITNGVKTITDFIFRNLT